MRDANRGAELERVIAATGSVAVVLLWWDRRERRRAERLDSMQRAMAQDPENPHE